MNEVKITGYRTNRYFRSIELALAIVCLLVVATANAQPSPRMGISPDRYQIVFDERGGETQSLLVQNLSDEPLSLSLSVSNWELNDENQIVVAPPTESSLDQWIVINPLKVTIPPGAPQTIRWAVMPRMQPQQGEYRAIIFVEEELPPRENPNSTEIRMKMRYGLPIYGQVGETIESAQLNGVNVAKTGEKLHIDLSNDGNKHARMSGNYGIWPTAEFPGSKEALKLLRAINPENQAEAEFNFGIMPAAVILPGIRRSVPLDLKLQDAGEYTIQLNAEFAQLKITEAISFTNHDIDSVEPEDPSIYRVAGLPSAANLLGLAD